MDKLTTYSYPDELCEFFQVVRRGRGKTKRVWQRYRLNGDWILEKRPGAEDYLLGGVGVLDSIDAGADIVALTEGEPDQKRFQRETDIPTATHHGGAGKFTARQAFLHFAGYAGTVLILADDDEAGWYCALRRHDLLVEHAGLTSRQIRIYLPPDTLRDGSPTPDGYDVDAAYTDGYGLADFRLVDVARLRARHPRAAATATYAGQEAEGEQAGSAGRYETQSQKLMRIALARYRFGRDDLGKPFAVPLDGSGVVRYLGKSSELANELAKEFYRKAGKPPSANAISEARNVLAGLAAEGEAEPVALRVGRDAGPAGAIVIDMGDADERAIVVRPGSWELVDKSPILFRRTKATLPFPEPIRGGDFAGLRGLLNVGDADWKLVVAYLIVSFIPEIQHAVLYINGEQGTGKSDMTRMLVMLMDPTSVPLRKKPRDDREWSSAANASWVVPLENMSNIPEWLSDDLCRAVSGEGVVERQLYSNDDVNVRSFRRIIVLNGIETLGIRPDLADRMLMLNLSRIAPADRKSEDVMKREFAAVRPAVFGAILDGLAAVLKIIETGKHVTVRAPRLADFAYHLHAVDLSLNGFATFRHFCRLQDQLSADISKGDVVAAALEALTKQKNPCGGKASELLADIERFTEFEPGRHGFPKSAKTLSAALRRNAPGLRKAGWTIEDRIRDGTRRWSIQPPA
ncbi:MAG TPA: hypothetical protein VFU43_18690 [Streptosporangiaceae bacterium]|nr:hypothetical protein [Streptosporangiaceae bacterium]